MNKPIVYSLSFYAQPDPVRRSAYILAIRPRAEALLGRKITRVLAGADVTLDEKALAENKIIVVRVDRLRSEQQAVVVDLVGGDG